MIHGMNRNEKSLIGQEWGIIDWTGMNDLLNEQEWLIHWMIRNEWYIEWSGMNDSLNEQEWRIIEWTGKKDLVNEQE